MRNWKTVTVDVDDPWLGVTANVEVACDPFTGEYETEFIEVDRPLSDKEKEQVCRQALQFVLANPGLFDNQRL